MTAYDFMVNAFYFMAGTVCVFATLMVLLGLIAGIRRTFERQGKKDREDS